MKDTKKSVAKEKSAWLYIVFLIIWLATVYYSYTFYLHDYLLFLYHSRGEFILGTMIFNFFLIILFWTNGLQHVVYVVNYYFFKQDYLSVDDEIFKIPDYALADQPRVLLIYCTCNDFSGESLEVCMRQDYQNFETVILDDSSNPDYLEEIDAFAAKNQTKVVRRANRVGFKAGNINNFLKKLGPEDYQYIVILDSDEIIPPNFIKDALRYFQYYEDVGLVQAMHVASRDRNKFMTNFSKSVVANWRTYQNVKQKSGFLFFFGHGAMISRDCYEAAGGFPEIVAEDIAFSLEARLKGYYTIFANRIICEEEYPIDYFAFRKRHRKWGQGNLEFVKTYMKRILLSSLNWYEKLDVLLLTSGMMLTGMFTIFMAVTLFVSPTNNFYPYYPYWLLIPTAAVFLGPMLNDLVYFFGRMSIREYVKYILLSTMLYGSLFRITFSVLWRSLLSEKAVFIVTPKTAEKVTIIEAIYLNKEEIIYSIALGMLSIAFTKHLYSVLLIILPGLSSVYLSMMHQLPGDFESEKAASDNEVISTK